MIGIDQRCWFRPMLPSTMFEIFIQQNQQFEEACSSAHARSRLV